MVNNTLLMSIAIDDIIKVSYYVKNNEVVHDVSVLNVDKYTDNSVPITNLLNYIEGNIDIHNKLDTKTSTKVISKYIKHYLDLLSGLKVRVQYLSSVANTVAISRAIRHYT